MEHQRRSDQNQSLLKPGDHDLNRILEERRKQHGDFRDNAAIIQSFKRIAHNSPGWCRMSDTQREGVEMIMHKLGRILAGDPNHHDHWLDIGGYARITQECIQNCSGITKPDPP